MFDKNKGIYFVYSEHSYSEMDMETFAAHFNRIASEAETQDRTLRLSQGWDEDTSTTAWIISQEALTEDQANGIAHETYKRDRGLYRVRVGDQQVTHAKFEGGRVVEANTEVSLSSIGLTFSHAMACDVAEYIGGAIEFAGYM